MARLATVAVVGLVAGGCATAAVAPEPLDVGTEEVRLREATVVLIQATGRPYCTGSLVERRDQVVTAAHCLRGAREVILHLPDHSKRRARVVGSDESTDVAVVRFDPPAPMRPLPLAGDVRPGDELWFLGQPRAGRPLQHVRVRKLARCPRLPTAGDVVYSTHRGFPGDSGAPVVSRDGVVGVVSGGRNCEMSIPAHHIRALLNGSPG